jgi:Domain of unknown function (DUF4349)
MSVWHCMAGILAAGLIFGCGESSPQMGMPNYEGGHKAAMSPSMPTSEMTSGQPPNAPFAKQMTDMAEGQRPDGQPGLPDAARPMPPKIIRTADIHLIVDNFDQALDKFKRLVEGIKGAYIAKAEVSGSAGAPRNGSWKVRIPASAFDSFLDKLSGLGLPDRNVIDSRDVTEEFYDLEARLRNKKAEETRLVKHLDTSTGKLEEILKVEHEISRVRGEIEQLEGRLRLIENLTSLTTVSVTIQEIKNYQPPQSPTFGAKIERTFTGSKDVVLRFGEMVVLFFVGLTPWLPVLALVGLLLYGGMRIGKRGRTLPQAVAVNSGETAGSPSS